MNRIEKRAADRWGVGAAEADEVAAGAPLDMLLADAAQHPWRRLGPSVSTAKLVAGLLADPVPVVRFGLAEKVASSWWPDFSAWLRARSGERVDSPSGHGSAEHPPLCPAPGTYVHAT